jgi:hypothetical protein
MKSILFLTLLISSMALQGRDDAQLTPISSIDTALDALQQRDATTSAFNDGLFTLVTQRADDFDNEQGNKAIALFKAVQTKINVRRPHGYGTVIKKAKRTDTNTSKLA